MNIYSQKTFYFKKEYMFYIQIFLLIPKRTSILNLFYWSKIINI